MLVDVMNGTWRVKQGLKIIKLSQDSILKSLNAAFLILKIGMFIFLVLNRRISLIFLYL